MNSQQPHDTDRWLDDLLARSAAPHAPDDGFSVRVMQRVNALALPAAAAEPAPCLAPDAALTRLPAIAKRTQRRQWWTSAGVVVAAVIGLLTLWAQPGPMTVVALALASATLPWLLLRDPQF